MARIRSIKPEFPQSETVGRLSRDARLLFIQLWTLVDDSGRTRASSRILASLLYPYDGDVFDLIEGWLEELEHGDCVRRYTVDGNIYLEVVNWLKHQKIDRPSASRIPKFDESSRILANTQRASDADLGSRTKDLGPRKGSRTLEKKPSRSQAPSDPRHAEFRNALGIYWKAKNPKFPEMPWDGADAKALAKLLSASPTLTLTQFQELLQSRARSQVASGERIFVWVAKIHSYVETLNQFKLPGGLNGSKAEQRASEIKQNLARAVTELDSEEAGDDITVLSPTKH